MARDTSLSGRADVDSRTIRDPLRRETGPLLLCKFAQGYMCRCDEVICCEVMEWQRTSLARNRNADRVGINFFIKENICLTEMIGIARRLRRSGRMDVPTVRRVPEEYHAPDSGDCTATAQGVNSTRFSRFTYTM